MGRVCALFNVRFTCCGKRYCLLTVSGETVDATESVATSTAATEKNGLETVLTYAQDNQRVVALELNKSGERNVIGYVTEQSESCICIRQLSEFGQWDGSSYVKSSAVTRVYIGDTDTTCLELLSAQDIGQ